MRGQTDISARPDKRFATIGATRVAYFDTLMQTDDITTTTALRSLRRDLVVPMLASHGGRLLTISGNTMVLEFGSAEEAVLYAMALQRAMMSRNATVAVNQHIWFLFGIHHGDVVFDGNDVYGDGVSFANDIADRSDPGGISVSQAVLSRIPERLALPFKRRDDIRLPGTDTAVEIFGLPTAYVAAQPDVRHAKSSNMPRVRMAIREGTQLNDAYEIDRLIGSGGMGEIFRGHEIQTGDAVAIKLIRLDMEDNEAALSLFQKEASVLKHIYHEAVVRYYVFSLDQIVGRHFLAMEFVNGPSLSTLIQDGPLPLNELTALRKRVGGGLQVAHERGIVHRDVTPDNIILPDGDAGQAKIIDFGIARSTNLGGGTIIGGGFAGKYNYVSPEQLGLFGGDVTAKSDIYSFGLVLAAAAGGRPLVMDGSHADTIENRRKIPDLDHIDARLRPLLASMLQPDPNDRPDSMAEVASWSNDSVFRALDTPVTDHRGPGSRPAPAAAKVKSRPKTKVERWIFGGAALVAAVGIGCVILFQSMGSQPTPRPNDQGALLVPGTASPQPDTTLSKQAATPIGEGAASGLGATVPKSPPQTGQPVLPPSGAGSTVASLEANETQIGSFLRTFDGGPCFFAHTTSATATSASIEAFAASNAAFETFDQAMTKAVGFEPDITGNRVWSHQCPAVDFLRARQKGGRRPKAAIFLRSTRVKSGQSLAGEVSGTGGQSVLLFDIREDGMVENLSRLLKEKSGGQDFDIPLVSSEEEKGPYPRLILVVAAPSAPILPTGPVQADEFFKVLAGKAADLDVSAKMVLLAR